MSLKINGQSVTNVSLQGQTVVRILNTASGEVLWEADNRDYLYLENLTSDDAVFTLTRSSFSVGDNDLQYKVDNGSWTDFDLTQDSTTVPVTPNGRIYLRKTKGVNSYTVGLDKSFSLHGDIASLVDYNEIGHTGQTCYTSFTSLFAGNVNLVDVDVNFDYIGRIEATYAFYGTFYGCTALRSVSDFKMTSLPYSSFQNTFRGCVALVQAPDFINLTIVYEDAFHDTFNGCTSLKTPPYMDKVSIVKPRGCTGMFNGCTELRYGPDLSNVAQLSEKCFSSMYSGCSKLQTVYTPNVTTWSTIAFTNWVSNAGTDAEEPLVMWVPTQELADLIPSGADGYGAYTKTLIPQPTPTVYELKIINELDGITYDVDGGNEIFLPNTYGDVGVIEVPGTASTITFHDAEPSKLRIIEVSSITGSERVDGYAINLATFDTTRQIHIYEH